MSNGMWWETPMFPILSDIFYPCWVTNGDLVCLGHFRDGEWKIGKGIAADASEITHYHFLQAPPPPNQINSENKEVIYANL